MRISLDVPEGTHLHSVSDHGCLPNPRFPLDSLPARRPPGRSEPVAWLIKRGVAKGRYYVCFRTGDGRVVRRAAGKSLRVAERVKAKIETEVVEGKFFDRPQRSDWTLGRLSEVYLER